MLRTKYGNALCLMCYKAIKHWFTYAYGKCARCGKHKEVYGFTNDTGLPLCYRCKITTVALT